MIAPSVTLIVPARPEPPPPDAEMAAPLEYPEPPAVTVIATTLSDVSTPISVASIP